MAEAILKPSTSGKKRKSDQKSATKILKQTELDHQVILVGANNVPDSQHDSTYFNSASQSVQHQYLQQPQAQPTMDQSHHQPNQLPANN